MLLKAPERVPLVEASIDQLSEALTSGEITSVELVAGYLNRIAAYDRRGPRLNSTPVINHNCFAEARRCDETRRIHPEKIFSPLHGIPFTVKDSFKVAGLTVAAGSPAFAKLIAQSDSFAVSALREHGAIVLGKTNMPPMAIGGCQRGVYGRAESPYNPDYLPAAWHSGSSSGSGVAVSASLCSFGLGEETVSSGRSPASNGGLVAYTPSRGLISIRGNWPLFALRDTVVPHTRTVRDLLHVLEALMSEDKTPTGDLWKSQKHVILPLDSFIRPERLISLATPGGLNGRRFGIPKMYTGQDREISEPIQVRRSIIKLLDDARDVLARLGATCIDVDLPVVSAYEKDRVGTRNLVDRGMMPPGWNEIEINDLVSASWDEFLRLNSDIQHPSLGDINPWIIHADPPEAVDTRRTSVAHDGQDRILYDYIVRRARQKILPQSPLDFDQLAEVCLGLERARKDLFEQWLIDSGLDGILFPANADVAPSNADTDETASEIAWRNGTVFSNMNHVMRHLGIPSISVTMGVMEDTAMPVGITFAGPAYSDAQLLKWAFDYESASPKRNPPQSTPELSPFSVIRDSGRFSNHPLDSKHLPPLPSVTASGTGELQLSGEVHLAFKAVVSTPSLEGNKETSRVGKDQQLFLSVQIVIDGKHHLSFKRPSPSNLELFESRVEIPASERRGARLQSSLFVVVASTYYQDSSGQVGNRVTDGCFVEVPYRYPQL